MTRVTMGAGPASGRTFLAVSAALFAASAAATLAGGAAMAGMGGMPMPGGWSMSMAWMRMPGQSWAGAAAAFLAMWEVMMVAMMLPSLVPMLVRYRRGVAGAAGARLGWWTAWVGLGYFLVWAGAGLAVYLLGAGLADLEMRWPVLARSVPALSGATVLAAALLQFTDWKAHHLACCRRTPGTGRALPAGSGAAWRFGVRHGGHCLRCCLGPTLVLLALGVMDLRVMAVATGAITLERLAPGGERLARVLGAVGVVAGLVLIARAAGAG